MILHEVPLRSTLDKMKFLVSLLFLIVFLVQTSFQSQYVRKQVVKVEIPEEVAHEINEDAALFTLQTFLDLVLLDSSNSLVMLMANYDERFSGDYRKFYTHEISKFEFDTISNVFGEFAVKMFDRMNLNFDSEIVHLREIAISYLTEKFVLDRAIVERLLPAKMFTFEAVKSFIFELRSSLKQSGEYADLLALSALELSTSFSSERDKHRLNAAFTLRRHIYSYLERNAELPVIVEVIRNAGGFLMDKLQLIFPDVMEKGKEMLKKYKLFPGVDFDKFQANLQALNRGETFFKLVHNGSSFEEQRSVIEETRLVATALVLEPKPDQIHISIAHMIYLEMKEPGFVDKFGRFLLTHESFHCFTSHAIHQQGKLGKQVQDTSFIKEGSAEYFTELSFSDSKLELERFRACIGFPDYYLRGRKFVKALSDLVGFSKAMEILIEKPAGKKSALYDYLVNQSEVLVSKNDQTLNADESKNGK